MTSATLRQLLLLSALWGGSFIFIRVTVPLLGPIVTAEARVLIAGLALLLYAIIIGARLELQSRWPQYLLIGTLNSAVPFALISAAEIHLSASMAAILNATSPLFGAVISAVWLKELLTGRKIVGTTIAVVGVVVLVGWSPLPLNSVTLISIGASLLASALYGLAGTYTRAKVTAAPPLGMAVGSQLGASLMLTPLLPFMPPTAAPSLVVILCVLTLALFSTALAYVLYFRLIVDIGATRALTVTFLAPIFGVIWGALFLGEGITVSKVVGCGIILLGTAFVTGTNPRSLGFRTSIHL